MTIQTAVGLGVLVLIAVLVGAVIAVAVAGGDPVVLIGAAAGVAFLGGLIVADLIRRRGAK